MTEEGKDCLKTLVTGSTGFIGSAITRQLVSEGVEVKVLVRETSDTRNIDGLDVERCKATSVMPSPSRQRDQGVTARGAGLRRREGGVHQHQQRHRRLRARPLG
jgi:nucleoside-diphosphate-sugar epimerase